LRPDERDLLAEWLAVAGDVSTAFVSSRRTDSPAIYRKIVISVDGDGEPTYLIDTPAGTDLWIVVRCRPVPDAYQFDSLRDALNFVRPVLSDASVPATDGDLALHAIASS
jgi:hypothetical protein